VGHVASFGPLDENKWLGFEEKLMGNFFIIARDLDPRTICQMIVSHNFVLAISHHS
jgi:hypothetical protein